MSDETEVPLLHLNDKEYDLRQAMPLKLGSLVELENRGIDAGTFKQWAENENMSFKHARDLIYVMLHQLDDAITQNQVDTPLA